MYTPTDKRSLKRRLAHSKFHGWCKELEINIAADHLVTLLRLNSVDCRKKLFDLLSVTFIDAFEFFP
jgi:hypothetical protein